MQYEIISLTQNSDKWKEWRRNYIGASDAPVIQEVSPWKTLLQLWEEKIEGKDQPTTAAMERGKDLEPLVRNKMSHAHFAAYQPICAHSKVYDWMVASLDGWDDHADFPLIEIKCPNEEAHGMAINGQVPEYYYPQLQHSMVVMGVDECLYVSYNEKFEENQLIYSVVKKDHEYCKFLIEREEKFAESLINFEPPTPTERDRIVLTNDEALKKADEYICLLETLERLEEKKDELKKEILSFVNHPRTIIGSLKATKILRQGNVQYSKIPELKGVDLNKYRKDPIQYWNLSS